MHLHSEHTTAGRSLSSSFCRVCSIGRRKESSIYHLPTRVKWDAYFRSDMDARRVEHVCMPYHEHINRWRFISDPGYDVLLILSISYPTMEPTAHMSNNRPKMHSQVKRCAYLSTARQRNQAHRRGASGVFSKCLARGGSSSSVQLVTRCLRAANAPSRRRCAFTYSTFTRGTVSVCSPIKKAGGKFGWPSREGKPDCFLSTE